MKQSILLLFSFLIANFLFAQVGINTNNPLAVFHIDGDGLNSTTPTLSEQLNDVVITKDGNLGIGTITPPNKLSINTTGSNTGLHLPNGASAGKVLTSDASGNSSWQSGAIQHQTMAAGTGKRTQFQGATETTPIKLEFFTDIRFDTAKDIYGLAYGWDKEEQEYVAPVKGNYRIAINAYFTSETGDPTIGYNHRMHARINKKYLNNAFVSSTDSGQDRNSYIMLVVKLDKGDKIDFVIYSSNDPLGRILLYGSLNFFLIESL
jgi:hypothetical protein